MKLSSISMAGIAAAVVCLLSTALLRADTEITDGFNASISEIASPDELFLDPDTILIAVDSYGNEDREVNGVLFQTDRCNGCADTEGEVVNGAVTFKSTSTHFIDGWAVPPIFTGGAGDSADNLAAIMEDIRWSAAPSPVTVEVEGLPPGRLIDIQLLFTEGADRNRRWDIGVGDLDDPDLVIDDFTSEGVSDEGVWTNENSFVARFEAETSGDGKLIVVMRQHIAGQDPPGGDNNPILQAVILHEKADGGPPLIAHFPLDSDGSSADGAFVPSKVTNVEFGEAGANANTGKAATFNGGSSVIQHDFSEILNPDGNFTLALWAKSEGGAGTWNSPVTSRHDLNPDSQGYLIYDSQPDGTWTFWSGNGVEAGNWQTLPGPEVNLGEWEHVAITYDDEAQVKKLYVNGEEEATQDESIHPNDTTPFNIGAGQDFGDGFWFDGLIDDIGLWGAVLTEAQIQQAMNNGVASLNSRGPDVLLTFNEGDELPEGIELVGSAEIREEDGVDDTGYLKITDAANGEYGAVVFPDLLNGKPVKSFKFTADFRVGGGTDRPADGFSVNLVRPDDPLVGDPPGEFAAFSGSPNGNEASLPEEGSTTGLGIGFDEWDSGAPDVVGFSVRVDGELITQIDAPTLNGEADDVESLQTGPIGPDGPGDLSELTWQPFEVELKEDGTLTIKWKGETVLDNFATAFFPSPVQIVFGGRTGGANAAHHVDNIGLTIEALDALAIAKVTDSETGLVFELTESEESMLNNESVSLKIDGADVTPVIADIEGGASISYSPPTPWEPGVHTYVLVAQDGNGNDAIRSGPGEFEIFGTVIKGGGEFETTHVWTEGDPQIADVATAEEVTLEPGDAENITVFTQYIHFHDNANAPIFQDLSEPYPLWGPQGNDEGPGDRNDFAIRSVGQINITRAGTITFACNSDDGFDLRIDGESIGEAGNRGRGNTFMPVELTAGVHDLEFIHWERGGGAGVSVYVFRGVSEAPASLNADEWQLLEASGGGSGPFQIETVALEDGNLKLTWLSSPGESFVIEQGTDLQEWEEVTDGYPSGGDVTEYELELTDPAPAVLYVRVRREE